MNPSPVGRPMEKKKLIGFKDTQKSKWGQTRTLPSKLNAKDLYPEPNAAQLSHKAGLHPFLFPLPGLSVTEHSRLTKVFLINTAINGRLIQQASAGSFSAAASCLLSLLWYSNKPLCAGLMNTWINDVMDWEQSVIEWETERLTVLHVDWCFVPMKDCQQFTYFWKFQVLYKVYLS